MVLGGGARCRHPILSCNSTGRLAIARMLCAGSDRQMPPLDAEPAAVGGFRGAVSGV